MKKLYTSLCVTVFAVLAGKAQIATYDIPFSQTIGLQQTTGDICSAPWNVEEAFQQSANNTWGFTWSSTNTGVVQSVEITLAFTIVEGGGSYPTTLNGNASFNVSDGAQKYCENSTILTWNVDPQHYNAGGMNTFMVDFSSTDTVSQVDNLPFMDNPFFRVTVNYSPCGTIDTTLTENMGTLTANATGTNYTYQWIDCASGNPLPGETSSSITPLGSGDYAVVITDTTSGCSDTSECITVIVGSVIDPIIQSINVYPNPANNALSIELNENVSNATYSIYSIDGSLIKRAPYMQNELIDLSGIESGAYTIHILDNDKVYTSRFVKQ